MELPPNTNIMYTITAIIKSGDYEFHFAQLSLESRDVIAKF